MDNQETNTIAQVIYNKIYNENIKVYEQAAYEQEGNDFYKKILPTNAITILDIKKAIEDREDLNQINGLDMKNYVNMDLGSFFSKVTIIRGIDTLTYERFIMESSIDSMALWLRHILECFTEEEQIGIKKNFLKRILNFDVTDLMTNERIDNFFWKIYFEIFESTIQKEQEISKKLV